ncbi:zinc ion binding [Striga hermonthica]|uniref:Zinc ion binding n=1 Tax=Striga hermonthica TaxID=68872 RepID=A0A9N7N0K6_STRHE|nr:zinc ion binding [Striga hermonthica]
MSSSTSQSSRLYVSPHSSQKICDHGKEVDVFTSMTQGNLARRFNRCSRRKGPEDCGHFGWIDPSLPLFQKGCFVNLMGQKKSLEEKLRCKEVMENLR